MLDRKIFKKSQINIEESVQNTRPNNILIFHVGSRDLVMKSRVKIVMEGRVNFVMKGRVNFVMKGRVNLWLVDLDCKPPLSYV